MKTVKKTVKKVSKPLPKGVRDAYNKNKGKSTQVKKNAMDAAYKNSKKKKK